MHEEAPFQRERVARLEDYLAAVRSHPILVVCLPLIAALLVFSLASSRSDTFEGTASVALGPSPIGSINANLERPVEEKEAEILQSNDVAEAVVADLGTGQPGASFLRDLTVQFVPGSNVLKLRYESSEPASAAQVVNGFAAAYVAQREAEADDFYASQIAVLDDQISVVAIEVADLDAFLLELNTQRLTEISLGAEGQGDLEGITALVTDTRVSRADRQRVLSGLEDDQRDLTLKSRSRQVTAEVLQESPIPSTPLGVSTNLLTVGGFLLGLVSAIAVAFLWERLDTKAKSSMEISAVLGTSILGEVPRFARGRTANGSLVMVTSKSSNRLHFAREGYRRLRSVIQFSAMNRDDGGFVVALTSSHPGEGKSVTSANLAISLAQAGRVVIIVSADMRRPTIESLFDLPFKDVGLSTALAGSVESFDLLDSGVERLYVLPAGPLPANPAELLASGALENIIAQLRQSADFVIIDTPPLLSVADALTIGSEVDGTVIVVDAEATDSVDLAQARSELERAGVEILGAVMNRVRRRRSLSLRRNHYAYSSAPASANKVNESASH